MRVTRRGLELFIRVTGKLEVRDYIPVDQGNPVTPFISPVPNVEDDTLCVIYPGRFTLVMGISSYNASWDGERFTCGDHARTPPEKISLSDCMRELRELVRARANAASDLLMGRDPNNGVPMRMQGESNGLEEAVSYLEDMCVDLIQ